MVNAICFECGNTATENAHVVPKIRGGTKTIPLCGRCHGLAHGMNRSNDIGALTKEGMAKAKEKGAVFGSPVRISPEIVKRIVTEYESGKGYREIARLLNSEAIPTVRGLQWYASTVRSSYLASVQ